jgi:formylglycine-generating enzyme required for sulfatase activity
MMKMKINFLLTAAAITLLCISGCDNVHNPFFPEKKEQGTKPTVPPATVEAAVPVISGQPQNAVYHIGAQAAALTVSASVSDEGTLGYQWYSHTENSNENGTLIYGETAAHYTPPTAALGVAYYYVVVTNILNGKTAAITSNTAKIEVNNKINAAVPVISGQPQGATYSIGAAAQALTVTASVSDGGTLSYQWYSHTVDNNEEGTVIPGATGTRYAPPTAALGVVYYYAVVTNTITNNGDGGNKTAAAASVAAGIEVNDKVNAAVPVITVQPQGGAVYSIGDTPADLTVVASASDGGTLSYRWYSNTIDSNEGGTAIPGAGGARANYTPLTDEAGVRYYYVVVINSIEDNGDEGNKSAPVASNTAGIGVGVASVTITGLSVANKVYDGTTTATVTGTAVISGLVGGDTVTVNAGTAAFADKNAGTGKTVTFSGWSLGGADAGKYILSGQPASVTADITAKSVTITVLSAANKVYDGTTAATGTVNINGKIDGDDVTAGGTAAFVNKNVGTGKTVTFNYVLSGTDAENYSLLAQPVTGTADITAKPVTITGLSADDKVYDGTTDVTVSGTVELEGLVDGDDVSVVVGTAVFENATAGNGKTVTFSGYSLTGTDAGNYTLSAQPESVTANITAKSVTITGLSAVNKQYDSTTTAVVTGVAVIDGLVDGDTVTIVEGTALFENASIGDNKTVTFTGWSLSGADAENYSLAGQPESVTANITSMIDMVPIPAGTFMMGSPASEPNRSSNETQHSVTLTKSFYMSTYQVTQAQYRAVMGAGEDRTTTTYGKGDNYPVYYVNWYDAIVFCNKLSMMEGLSPVYSIGGSTDPAVWITNNGGSIPTSTNATWNGAVMDSSKNGYRLPTEAEWEYACRGDYPNKATETNTKPFGIGDGTKMVSGMANFDGKYPYDLTQSGQYNDAGGTYLGKTTEVGSYEANNYGLYDMHGNLYEWCWDWYKADITADNSDPTGAVTGSYRVLRGGYWNWDGSGQYLRSASRINNNPGYRRNYSGFRLVRSGS